MSHASEEIANQIKAELAELDKKQVQIDGKALKPSQCYRFQLSPTHVLFNTNCPDSLRKQVQEIISKYLPHESGAQ